MGIGFKDWIVWLGATCAACVALSSSAYQIFQTKDDAREFKGDIKAEIHSLKEDIRTMQVDMKGQLDRIETRVKE